MSKINEDATLRDVVTQMSDGVVGTVSVFAQLAGNPLLYGIAKRLDNEEIYGSGIWVIYKDFCGEDITKFMEHVLVSSGKTLQTEAASR